MDHHTTVGQGRTLALFACYEQNGTHRGCHTCTDGGHVAGNELHRVVDAQACRHTTARGIDVDRDILTVVYRVKVEQLCLQCVGSVIVDLCAEEDDAVHHQTGEYIHLRHVQLTLLKDIWIQILSLRFHYVVERQTIHS